MDYASILITIVMMAIFIGPVIYLNTAQKAADKKLLKVFLSLASQHHLNITEADCWNGRYAIGLDPKSKKLFFIKKEKDNITESVTDLSKIKSCSANRVTRTTPAKNSNREITTRLELVLIPTASQSDSSSSTLIFYKEDESSGLANELPLLKKWEQIVRDFVA